MAQPRRLLGSSPSSVIAGRHRLEVHNAQRRDLERAQAYVLPPPGQAPHFSESAAADVP